MKCYHQRLLRNECNIKIIRQNCTYKHTHIRETKQIKSRHLQRKFVFLQGSIYSLFLYDAVYLYMTMMEQIVSERLEWRNGTFWLNMARNWVTYGE